MWVEATRDGEAALKTDLLIAGGGLAGGLIALALAQRRPEVTVTLVEAGARVGGNHIWSFFDGDVAAAERAFVDPLVCHHWDGHEVAFPGVGRTLKAGYNSIESERLDAVVRASLPGERVVTGAAIVALDPAGAALADGRRIEAGGVIDTRGAVAAGTMELGWQKFLGRLLRLERPHGLSRPVIMDATVDQTDGYRFVYVLPFTPDHVFVEDTYYSESPALDLPRLGGRIEAYAAARGWRIAAVEREESAALPIVMAGDVEALLGHDGIGRAGMAAGLFQPMTGYSLPDAVRTAALVAAAPDLSSPALERLLREHAVARWRERGFYRLLARLLFHAAEPKERWRMLARFYALDERLVGRFYAARSTLPDKLRVLIGRPPVPIGRAISVIRESMA